MDDPVYSAWLKAQAEDALALTRESDLFEAKALAPFLYVLDFRCRGLARAASGEVREHGFFRIGVTFAPDHLRRVNPAELLTVLEPQDIFHPNARTPHLCIGEVKPGVGIRELAFRVWDVLTFSNYTVDERDALNPVACAWARNHPERFPIDRRPLKRRRIAPTGALFVEEVPS